MLAVRMPDSGSVSVIRANLELTVLTVRFLANIRPGHGYASSSLLNTSPVNLIRGAL